MFHRDPIRSVRDHEQAGRAKWRESQTIRKSKVTIHLRHADKSRINEVLVVVSSNGHWMVQQVRSSERYARFETGGSGEKQVTRIKRKARRNERGKKRLLSSNVRAHSLVLIRHLFLQRYWNETRGVEHREPSAELAPGQGIIFRVNGREKRKENDEGTKQGA